MRNTLGTQVAVTLFGESHGKTVGAVLDGMAPGIPVDETYIAQKLSQRRPLGEIATSRREQDDFSVVSGVYRGKTTGAPLTVLIPNEDTHSEDYAETAFLPRPGHGDYTAFCKYHGFADVRGGGHYSGRLTAPLVAVGAVALSALKGKGITVGTHIKRCAGVEDRPFADDPVADIALLEKAVFPVLEEAKGDAMRREITAAAQEGDSVGGILETAVAGLPAGIGEPWFDTVEGMLSRALFSIPAVKGVQFADAFSLAEGRGSAYNDAFCLKDGKICTATNHNGGVNAGISNGMPLLFQCAVKPTPSIHREQQTVNLQTLTEETVVTGGRHDPCLVHRARVVADSLTALVLCDLLAMRYGTDYLGGR